MTGLDASASPYIWSTESYSVVRTSDNQVVVEESPYLSGGDRFPIFDGLGLAFDNGIIAYDPTQSGHFDGPSDHTIDVVADITDEGPTADIGGLYPADYEIVF